MENQRDRIVSNWVDRIDEIRTWSDLRTAIRRADHNDKVMRRGGDLEWEKIKILNGKSA
jgi:hypothetical protein